MMKVKLDALLKAVLASALTIAGIASAQAAGSTQTFTAQYKGGTNSCGTTYQITGVAPADTAKHPVFLYMVGTWETYDNASAMAAIQGMAKRGYVSASVQYPNLSFGSCSTIKSRAHCIFDASSASSAIAAVCGQPGADCDGKGLVVGGFSQGSVIATLAHDEDSRVAAAWGMGDGVQYATYHLQSCMTAGSYSLSPDRLRIADGIQDIFLSPHPGGTLAQARAVTGLTGCADDAISCYSANGSGYHIVQNDEVQFGTAGHCYMREKDGCVGSQNKLDPGWLSGSADWELNTELDWLTGFTAH